MVRLRKEVSHRWERRMLLRAWRQGEVDRDSICDADFLLVEASKYHGYPAERACPVCEGETLREVNWIYGDRLGKRSNTARREEEIVRIVDEVGPVTVHLVEVCTRCRWNHLLETGTVEPGE